MINVVKYNTFGEHLRALREKASLSLREVSLRLNIDHSLLAKIERNERCPTKQLIKQISSYFKVDEKELQNELLSDQIVSKILEEEADVNVLKLAEKKITYLKTIKNG